MTKSISSRRWLDRHVHDEYVQRAQRDGYRSRSAYKLLEIQEKDRILRSGQRIVDLGAAPGGWSQVAANIVGRNGQVIGLDLLPIQPLLGVTFIRGDFKTEEALAKLHEILENKLVDLVLSDLSPNITGIDTIDQPCAMYLCELAVDLCHNILRAGGVLIVKVFQGVGFEEFYKNMQQQFRHVKARKPKASRAESREVYLVAREFKFNNLKIINNNEQSCVN